MRDGLAPHNSGSYTIVKREEMQTLTQKAECILLWASTGVRL
jgi:hypothetical protein